MHDDQMLHQLPLQRDHAILHTPAIHLYPRNAPLQACRILDPDFVYRLTVPIAQAEPLPPSGDDRIYRMRSPRICRPRISSTQARYIHAAAPVYHDQPP